MSENTPERLRAFRENYSGKRERIGKLALVQVALLVLILVFAVLNVVGRFGASAGKDGSSSVGLSEQRLRDYAGYLAERNLAGEAIVAYERYLDRAVLDDDARAKVCYSVAKLAMDAELYEKALGFLYQADMLAPDSGLTPDIGQKVVLCLDKLDRAVDLRHELYKRGDMNRPESAPESGAVVLAEFAGEKVTMRDLEEEIEKLPASMREGFNTPEKKSELLRNLVAERLLLDKARRLELDKDPEIQEALSRQLDAMIVRKLIDDDVSANVRITQEDVERFYKAEQDRFRKPGRAELGVGEADTSEASVSAAPGSERLMTIVESGYIEGSEADRKHFSQSAKDIWAKVSEVGESEVSEAIEIDGKWYAFAVNKKVAAEVMPLEQVEGQARQMLEMTKEQEQVKLLIDETLKARNVKLHLDRLNPSGAAK